MSVGLPTYNGARYIREALDSLLAQDHRNLEIVVADNASTDGTADIVREYADRDPRVRLVEAEANVGAPANFNRAFRATTGAYFLWAADDDRWEPSYVSDCLHLLLADPELVAVAAQVRFIDEDGSDVHLDYSGFDNVELRPASPRARVRILLRRSGWYEAYALIRRPVLERTRLFTDVPGPDVVLLVELALQGPIGLVPRVLHRYRQFERRSETERGARQGGRSAEPAVAACPTTYMIDGIVQAVRRSRLGLLARAATLLEVVLQCYCRSTSLHERTRRELPIRLRHELVTRRPTGLFVMGVLAMLSSGCDLWRSMRLRSS